MIVHRGEGCQEGGERRMHRDERTTEFGPWLRVQSSKKWYDRGRSSEEDDRRFTAADSRRWKNGGAWRNSRSNGGHSGRNYGADYCEGGDSSNQASQCNVSHKVGDFFPCEWTNGNKGGENKGGDADNGPKSSYVETFGFNMEGVNGGGGVNEERFDGVTKILENGDSGDQCCKESVINMGEKEGCNEVRGKVDVASTKEGNACEVGKENNFGPSGLNGKGPAIAEIAALLKEGLKVKRGDQAKKKYVTKRGRASGDKKECDPDARGNSLGRRKAEGMVGEAGDVDLRKKGKWIVAGDHDKKEKLVVAVSQPHQSR
jgi:hypothetical protein